MNLHNVACGALICKCENNWQGRKNLEPQDPKNLVYFSGRYKEKPCIGKFHEIATYQRTESMIKCLFIVLKSSFIIILMIRYTVNLLEPPHIRTPLQQLAVTKLSD